MSETKPLPQYRSIKVVGALKIASVEPVDGSHVRLTFYNPLYQPEIFAVNNRPMPSAEWYYVVYDNGYHSFSPQEQFEQGYLPLSDLQQPLCWADGPQGAHCTNSKAICDGNPHWAAGVGYWHIVLKQPLLTVPGKPDDRIKAALVEAAKILRPSKCNAVGPGGLRCDNDANSCDGSPHWAAGVTWGSEIQRAQAEALQP